MRGISKKMLISILTSVIVMVTMVATTFAWVGIFTYANAESFEINLKTQDLDSNYYLTISSTGKRNTFSDEVDINDIRKQILLNQYNNETNYDSYSNYLNSLTPASLQQIYKNNSHLNPSTTKIVGNEIDDFKIINLEKMDYFQYKESNTSHMKFDLYLSVDSREGIQSTSDFDLNVYMTDLENTLIGTICEYGFYNRNPFVSMPSANNILLQLPSSGDFKINSKNAVRFAFSIYNPINIDDDYTNYDNYSPIKTIIYHGGNNEPSINNDVFDLGGNLPEDSNTALQELLVIRPNYKNGLYINHNQEYEAALADAIARGNGDLDISEDNSKIWDSPNEKSYELIEGNKYKCNYLGVKDGIQTKMKITVYLWFEGWDADCLAGIQDKPITLNLTFTGGIEE